MVKKKFMRSKREEVMTMHGVGIRRSCTDISCLHFSFRSTPTSFCADSNNGVRAITSDRLQFNIIAHPGKVVTGFNNPSLHLPIYTEFKHNLLISTNLCVILTHIRFIRRRLICKPDRYNKIYWRKKADWKNLL